MTAWKNRTAAKPEKTADKFARLTAVLSLLVAIAAVALPYREQRRQFSELQTEKVAVTLSFFTDGPARLTNSKFGQQGWVVQIPSTVTLSNTGNLKTSILRYRITSGASPAGNSYTSIDGGMFLPNGTPVALPLTLDPGESKVVTVMIGVLVPPAVYKILAATPNAKALTRKQMTKILGKQSMDVFGNAVDYREIDGSYMIQFKEGAKAPRYWYLAETGRGNVFGTSSTPFEDSTGSHL